MRGLSEVAIVRLTVIGMLAVLVFGVTLAALLG